MSRRPDSAKTQVTKQTEDSQRSKRDLNLSKFSQTVSQGVSIYGEKVDTFQKYVAQKDKDPKYKHLKSKLQVVHQKAPKQQPQKINNKPFQIKKGKTIDKNKSQKVEEKQQKVQTIEKSVETPASSKGFAERNKKIMDSLNPVKIQKSKQAQKPVDSNKSKIDFGSFKVNNQRPKQMKKSIKVQKIEIKKQEQKKQVRSPKKEASPKKEVVVAAPAKSKKQTKGKTQTQKIRDNELRNLQRFVNDVESRNMINFPPSYDVMINRMSTSQVSDLQKIDLDDFLNDPTQGQYEILQNRIRDNDSKLAKQKVEEESINLEDIISNDDNQSQNQNDDDNASIYASISAEEMKKRNAFITEILAGKISKREIDRFEEMDRSTMRMYKIDREKQEDDVQINEINLVKKQSNRLMQRNKLQAAGVLYRDCDYLSEEHKQRLEQLLNSDQIESPFEFDQLQTMQQRRMDQGIIMYRQMNGSQDIGQILNSEILPKDPQLRKQAQKKVLKEKISSVNNRLGQVDKIVVTKGKIEALIKKFQHTKKSANYHSMSQNNQQKLNEQLKRLKEAEDILQKLSDKQNMQDLINEIQKQYKELQQQIKIANEMDAKELMRMQKDRLRAKLREVQQIQKISRQLGDEIDLIQATKKEVQQKLRQYDNIERIQIQELNCNGYKENQTLQDLDRLITSKWQSQNNHSN